jgi:hypothetical protein
MTAYFRVTTISLDRDQEVSVVQAIASPDTASWIGSLAVSGMDITGGAPDGTLVRMTALTLMEVFSASGKVRGDDPCYPHSHAVYDSLARVVFGLIEE